MTHLTSGHVVVEKSEEDRNKLDELFPYKGKDVPLVTLQPGGWTFLKSYIPYTNKVHDFELRSTDIMIMAHPKCGTIWTSELVWTMLKNVGLDRKLSSIPLMLRAPTIMMDHLFENNMVAMGEAAKVIFSNINPTSDVFLQAAQLTPDPRILKAHLPLSLMPENILDKCKVICIARNPKDVIISFKHYLSLVKSFNFVGNMDDLVDLFVNDELIFGPYWQYYKEAWSFRDHPNLHWIYFENLKTQTLEEIIRLDKFLETNLDKDVLKKIMEFTSFVKKKNIDPMFTQTKKSDEKSSESYATDKKDRSDIPKVNSGGWRNQLTVTQNAKMDAWIKKNSIDTDLIMKY